MVVGCPAIVLLRKDRTIIIFARYKYMRLDKYLKVSRIIKRRTVANEVCDAKHVEVNGKIARASYEVKVGDVIAIQMGSNLTKYKVLAVNEFAKKDDAANRYEVVS